MSYRRKRVANPSLVLTQQDISPYSSTNSRCVRINCSPRYDYDPSNVNSLKR